MSTQPTDNTPAASAVLTQDRPATVSAGVAAKGLPVISTASITTNPVTTSPTTTTTTTTPAAVATMPAADATTSQPVLVAQTHVPPDATAQMPASALTTTPSTSTTNTDTDVVASATTEQITAPTTASAPPTAASTAPTGASTAPTAPTTPSRAASPTAAPTAQSQTATSTVPESTATAMSITPAIINPNVSTTSTPTALPEAVSSSAPPTTVSSSTTSIPATASAAATTSTTTPATTASTTTATTPVHDTTTVTTAPSENARMVKTASDAKHTTVAPAMVRSEETRLVGADNNGTLQTTATTTPTAPTLTTTIAAPTVATTTTAPTSISTTTPATLKTEEASDAEAGNVNDTRNTTTATAAATLADSVDVVVNTNYLDAPTKNQAAAAAAAATTETTPVVVSTPTEAQAHQSGIGKKPMVEQSAIEKKPKTKKRKKEKDDISIDIARITQPAEVLRVLCEADDPYLAIHKFQRSVTLRLTSVEPAFNMLDFADVKRADLYRSILYRLVANLKETVPKIPLNIHTDLIRKSLTYIRVPELRELCTLLLSSHPSPPRKILRLLSHMSITDANARMVLSSHPQLRQRMWEHNLGAFMNHIGPLVENYVRHCVFRVDTDERFPKNVKQSERRTNNHLRLDPIRDAIGSSYFLYHHMVLYVRRRFVETGGDWRFCCLRVDMAMLLNDLLGSTEDNSPWKTDGLWQFAVYVEAYCNLVNRTVAESRTTISEVAKKVNAVQVEFHKVISAAHYACKEDAARMAVAAATSSTGSSSKNISGVKRPRTPTGGHHKSNGTGTNGGVVDDETAPYNELLFKELQDVLGKVEKEDANRLFRAPVLQTDPDMVNGTGQRYDEVIRRPMDTQTVRWNLERGQYTCFQSFKSDLKQIHLNSSIFWGDKNIITKTAKKTMVTRVTELCHQANQRIAKVTKRAKLALTNQHTHASIAHDAATGNGVGGSVHQYTSPKVKLGARARHLMVTSCVRMMLASPPVVNALIHGLAFALRTEIFSHEKFPRDSTTCRQIGFLLEQGAMALESVTATRKGEALDKGYEISQDVERRVLPMLTLFAQRESKMGGEDHALMLSTCQRSPAIATRVIHVMLVTLVHKRQAAGAIPGLIDTVVEIGLPFSNLMDLGLYYSLADAVEVQAGKANAATSKVWKDVRARVIDKIILAALVQHVHAQTERFKSENGITAAVASTPAIENHARSMSVDMMDVPMVTNSVKATNEPKGICTSGLSRMAVELNAILARVLLVQANTEGADIATLSSIVGESLGLLVHGVQGVLPGSQEFARMLGERYLSAEFGLARVNYEALFAVVPAVRENAQIPDLETVQSSEVLPAITEPPPEASPPLVKLVPDRALANVAVDNVKEEEEDDEDDHGEEGDAATGRAEETTLREYKQDGIGGGGVGMDVDASSSTVTAGVSRGEVRNRPRKVIDDDDDESAGSEEDDDDFGDLFTPEAKKPNLE